MATKGRSSGKTVSSRNIREAVADTYQSVYANEILLGASRSTYDIRLLFYELGDDGPDQLAREKKVRVVIPIPIAISLFRLLEKALPDIKKWPPPTFDTEE